MGIRGPGFELTRTSDPESACIPDLHRCVTGCVSKGFCSGLIVGYQFYFVISISLLSSGQRTLTHLDAPINACIDLHFGRDVSQPSHPSSECIPFK